MSAPGRDARVRAGHGRAGARGHAGTVRRGVRSRCRRGVGRGALAAAVLLAVAPLGRSGFAQSVLGDRVTQWVRALERADDPKAREQLVALGAEALEPLGRALEQAQAPAVWQRLAEVFELALRSRLQELDVELEAMPAPGEGGAELETIKQALGAVRNEIEAAGYAAARELARPGATARMLSALAREELLDDLYRRLVREVDASDGDPHARELLRTRLVHLGPLVAPLLAALEKGRIERVTAFADERAKAHAAESSSAAQARARLAARRAFAHAVREQMCVRYVAMLREADPARRRFAREALFGMGELARPWLERLREGDDPELQEEAALLLRRIEWGITEALYRRIGHLLPGFEDEPWRERRYAVYCLEKQGGAEAVLALRRVLERDPSRGVKLMAAESLARLGDVAGFVYLARAGLEPVLQSPEVRAQIAMDQGIRYLQIGRYDRAIAEFETVLELEHGNATALYNLACAYALKEETERACDYLEQAVEAGFDDLEHMEADPDLDNIREAPRYKALVERLRRERATKEAQQP